MTKTNIPKRKKPDFIRQDSHKKGRIKSRWRRARGLQSKVRLAQKGYRLKPKIGYGAPKEIKHLVKGLKSNIVSTIKELKKIPNDEGIIISKIGLKKKIELIKEAIKTKITILNIKNPELFLKQIEENLKQKKELKNKKIKTKTAKKEKAKEKAKEKEKKEDTKEKIEDKIEKTTEEMEKEKKKEKDKILTKKS
ncbi:hypothetical protein H8D83_00945 [Candidatus Woesearchaeota archaeon]|nr:hypothetical protein [Candidatus Woesearchaeota archaeon]MBL7050593.1 hypothetical protein [Candidatus Woesearchaeota archaeon]